MLGDNCGIHSHNNNTKKSQYDCDFVVGWSNAPSAYGSAIVGTLGDKGRRTTDAVTSSLLPTTDHRGRMLLSNQLILFFTRSLFLSVSSRSRVSCESSYVSAALSRARQLYTQHRGPRERSSAKALLGSFSPEAQTGSRVSGCFSSLRCAADRRLPTDARIRWTRLEQARFGVGLARTVLLHLFFFFFDCFGVDGYSAG